MRIIWDSVELCRVFFQNIVNAVEMTVDLAPPEGMPPDKWLHRHNKYWLQIRGLDTKGGKSELKERVAGFLAAGAPAPLPTPDIPPADVEAVLKALLEMLCHESTGDTSAYITNKVCNLLVSIKV